MSVPIPIRGDIAVNKTALKWSYPTRAFCGERGQGKITFISDNLMDKKFKLWLRSIASIFSTHCTHHTHYLTNKNIMCHQQPKRP